MKIDKIVDYILKGMLVSLYAFISWAVITVLLHLIDKYQSPTCGEVALNPYKQYKLKINYETQSSIRQTLYNKSIK